MQADECQFYTRHFSLAKVGEEGQQRLKQSRALSFAALQFVVITCYYASPRLGKNKQQCMLSTIQLRILG